MISHQELLKIIFYDPSTGDFKWRISRGGRMAGAEAGHVDADGYRIISLYNSNMPAHRIAWFYVYKNWPKDLIDHVNCCPGDNRIVNLREFARAA